MSSNNTRLIACITILILIVTLILDRLVPEGMFLDGVTYAAISRNLAIGKGTFWMLYYRSDWAFSEHPPLFFGLQAIFFKVLGDHYLTEKIYSFVIWVASAVLLGKLWTRTLADKNATCSFALPLLLWSLVPTVTWAYTNNILDTTMALFDLAAVYLLYHSLAPGAARKVYLIPVAAGVLIFCAMFTKGPVGAFPLAVPGIYWLVYTFGNGKELAKAIAQTAVMLTVIAAAYFVLYQFPDPRANLDRYLDQQLLAALSGRREITTGHLGRWALPAGLLMQMIVPVAIALILFVATRVLKLPVKAIPQWRRHALFFLLAGVAASMPIMMSVKQRTFYLVPSLPFYIIALTVVAYPYFAAITARFPAGNKTVRYFSISALVVSIGLCAYLGSKVGQVGRDHQLIANMKALAKEFPQGQVFGICAEADKDYAFLAYLQRYNQMEVNPVFYATEYVLIDKNVCSSEIVPFISRIGFTREPFGLDQYDLYHRQFPLRFDFTLLNPVYRTTGK